MPDWKTKSLYGSQGTHAGRMKFLFVTIAGADIGYGHVSRCLSLANCARRQEIESSFLVYGDVGVLQRIESEGYSCTVQPCADLAMQAAKTAEWDTSTFDAIVVDFAHPVVFRNIAGVSILLHHLRKQTKTLMVIDALGEQALVPMMPDIPADVVVAPYVGATAEENGTAWKKFSGPEYAVLSPAYAGLPQRMVREYADRLLVSCGGSDPKNLTLLVLEGIEQISKQLSVRVIVGPLFHRGLIDTLVDSAAGSHHSIELIHAPDGLVDHMLWCDLAVAASGLIKYELAASSTPAVLMSIDHSHDVVNRPFAGMGTVRDLGAEFDAQSVAGVISELLGDRGSRSAMAEAGRRLVDGQGANRLISELVRTFCVAK